MAWNTYQRSMLPETPELFDSTPPSIRPFESTQPIPNAVDWRMPQEPKSSTKKKKPPAHHEKSLHERLNPAIPKQIFEAAVAKEFVEKVIQKPIASTWMLPLPMRLASPLAALVSPVRKDKIGNKERIWMGEFPIDEVPSNQPRLYTEKLTFLGALLHWRLGKGQPVEVDMSKIDWHEFRPISLEKINNKIKNWIKKGSTQQNRIIRIPVIPKFEITASFLDTDSGKIYGSLSVNLKNILIDRYNNGNYRVIADVVPVNSSGLLDIFDFDPKPFGDRSIPAEIATDLMHYGQPGVPYRIYTRGTGRITFFGSLNE